MNDMTIEAFRRRLKTLEPDEATLERVSRTLAESSDERLKDPVVAEMVERFLLVPADSPDEIGAERRLEIFMNAGNKRVSSAVLGERGVKNAFIQKFGYGKYLDAAVSSGMMSENERKKIEAANERMFDAAGQGNIAGIDAALNSGAECGASRTSRRQALSASSVARCACSCASDSAADICARDKYSWTVAMRAAWYGHITPELVECLARYGCPMDARDNDGLTVAMRAAWYGHITPELVECLVKRGCPMDARDNYGRTVAMYAAWHGHITPELVECLVKRGCPMDARDNDGETVAVFAASAGRLTPELVECLVKNGCPMDARNKDGRTVAMFVARYGHITPELVECLVKHGCPMDARDKDGWTVAMFAASDGHLAPELVECLVKYGCPMDDIRIGENTAEGDRFASFVSWAKYAPGMMAIQALDSFSNAKKRAAGALALLSSGIAFDEETLPALAATFSKSRTDAVEHLLGDEGILRAIDGARFLELVSSGRALKRPMDAAAVRNLLSMCRSLLDERPEKLELVKTALLKTFAATFEECANDPEVAGLLQETMGRIAAIEEENSYSGPDEMPCL